MRSTDNYEAGGARAAAFLDADQLPVERGLTFTPEDLRRRTLDMRLMRERHLDYAALLRDTGIDISAG
jgi:coproporphyrinogen III oxidase-like Fe-S oxidoreductase